MNGMISATRLFGYDPAYTCGGRGAAGGARSAGRRRRARAPIPSPPWAACTGGGAGAVVAPGRGVGPYA